MEEEKKEGEMKSCGDHASSCCGGGGGCGCRNWCGWSGKHILRWVLGIAILALVFHLGYMCGRFHSMFDNDYGYGHQRTMMYRTYNMPDANAEYFDMPMMQK